MRKKQERKEARAPMVEGQERYEIGGKERQ